MQEFFIGWSEALVSFVMIVLLAAVPVGALLAFMTPASQGGGIVIALSILIGGGVYVILLGGMMFIMFGIYGNTRRSAELLEELLKK